MTARLAEIWRYPVKSVLGERLDTCDVATTGVVGDRAWGLVDADDGTVASAKHPRKWGGLLEWRAATLDDGRAAVTLPDGTTVCSDDPAVDRRLSEAVGRRVRLASSAEGRSFEEVWPDIDGLAPEEVIASTAVATEPSGERVSRFTVAMAAAGAGFVDVAPLHVMTTATLRRLAQLDPESTFDVRRYRPNFLLDVDGDGFVENDWVGRVVHIGAVALRVTIPTMRCVMTTLAQPGLGAERSTLRTIATHNRVEIPGLGTWACAGAYADVVAPGPVRVGDEVVVTGA